MSAEEAPKVPLRRRSGKRVAIASGLVVLLAGMLAFVANLSPNPAKQAPRTSTSSVSPGLSFVTPIGTTLTDTDQFAPIWWQTDHTNIPKYEIDTLRYLHGLAAAAGLPNVVVQYTVMQANQIVMCDDSRTPSYLSGNSTDPYVMMWCPKVRMMVIDAAAGSPDGSTADLYLSMLFFGDAIAYDPKLDWITVGIRGACFHGVMLRWRVDHKQNQEDRADTRTLLKVFYHGGGKVLYALKGYDSGDAKQCVSLTY